MSVIEEAVAGAERASPGARHRNRGLLGVIVALAVAVMLVGVGAWVFSDRTDDVPDVIRAGGGELTPRQEEMVEVVDEYVAAVQATDGDRIASHMAPTGYVEYLRRDWTFSVSDGSLQEWFSSDRYGSLRRVGPMVVYEDRVVLFGTVDDVSISWTSIIRFSAVGDVRIVSEAIDHW